MNIGSQKMDLDEAIAGMVLSREVQDGRGGVLLPSKTALTDALLTSLRRRGIATVCVVQDALSQDELNAAHERVQQRLISLFRKCGSDRIGATLLQQITVYRLGEIK
jgi:hypothetical protein